MVTLYGLANCDTCRKARNWLTRFGIEHAFVDYRERRVAPETLVAWKDELGGWDAMDNKPRRPGATCRRRAGRPVPTPSGSCC